MKQAFISSIASYLPEKRLTNLDLEKMCDTTSDWIVTRTGIESRRIAKEGQSASDMGFLAAQKLFLQEAIDKKQVDCLIVASMTPDYRTPSVACLLQSRLGLENIASFDVHAACSGFVYGLTVAKALIESSLYRKVLLVCAEKISSIIDYTDRNTAVLFGDGACAMLIDCESGKEGLRIGKAVLGSDGSRPELLHLDFGGGFLQMNGKEVFKEAVRRMSMASEKALIENGLTLEEIDWFLPHQANIRIIEAVARKCNFSMEKVLLSLQEYGNTSAASIPIGLSHFLESGKMQHGQKILITSFGAGLTWGALPLYCMREDR